MKIIDMRVFLLPIFFAINCYAQTPSISNAEVEGKWFVILNSNDIGTVNTVFEFETDDNTFVAWTRKGADRDILGFWKSTLARMFTKDFKNGSLIRITNGKMAERGDTLLLSGIFRSAVGNYYFYGEILNGHINAVLKNGKQEVRGTLSGRKNAEIRFPIDDYPKVITEAIDTAKRRIYNRKELKTKQWSTFEKKILKKSKHFQDDVELVFAFYYYSSKLPFSHFSLTKIDEDVKQNSRGGSNQYLFLEEKDSNTALLTIKSFSGNSTEVDSVFSIIIEKGYQNLIVDLRNNPGGTVEAGMAFARKVVDTTLIGGIFLTQKWFNENDEIPGVKQFDDFPFFSQANYDLIIEGIHKEKGLVLKVEPSNIRYKGKIYIITNKRTASTCEPLVYGLKTSNRAIIVGETTAGAMLNGEQFKLPSGFSVFVPTADYYTVDGLRIDQNGVEPNIKLAKEEPVDFILNQLIK